MGTSKYKESSPGTYYHLYNRGNQKQRIFQTVDDYLFYLKRLKKYTTAYNFSLICYCLMPNHIHLIVRQDGDYPPPKLMSSLHTSYSIVYNLRHNTVGHLFQDRYKQKIIAHDDYMLCLIAYIHMNPVKDNLCKFPKQYQWSSYSELAGYARSLRSALCNHHLLPAYGLKGLSFEEYIKQSQYIDPLDAFDD